MLVSAVLLAPLAIAGFAVAGDPGEDDFYKQFPVFQDILRLVRQAYVDEVDLSELMAGAFQGLGDALDPFSTLVPGEYVFQVQELGRAPSPSGIVLAHSNGVLFVVSVLPGGPAEAAEIRPGDILTDIGGVTTRNLPLWNAELNLAQVPAGGDANGEGGEGLEVGILRGGEQRSVTLRDPLTESEGARLEVAPEAATLRLFEVSEATAGYIAEALAAPGADSTAGLLVDLRQSWGDGYQAAAEIARLLGGSGATDLVDRNGRRTRLEVERQPAWSGPVVVLVGQATHGAGELLAHLLAEHYQTVGQSTFGYMGRAAWLPAGDGAQIRTADGFYGPAGEGTWEEPLEPEIVVSGRDRRFSQKDRSLDELTEERGLEVLRSAGLDRAA